MLKLIDIKKIYELPGQRIDAVNGVSLEFRRSEFVSILGPSGCGKTTMLNIIGGLDQYTEGDLIIEETSTKKYTDANWDNYRNKRIGFVFQSYNLIPHLTVSGNVEMALTISGISLSERKERAKRALQEVGLGDQLNKKPNQLSGGQMQRVAIARALVNEPEILLADEPTGALDSSTSKQIMELMRDISKNRLVIMVTHNTELAEAYSTRIVRIRDGLVIDDTNHYVSSELDKKQTGKKANVESEVVANKKKNSKNKDAQKTSMSFLTALSLSWRNLLTKLKRSIMTSIASAIGILGIALILALSTGLQGYINEVTREQVESTPITISTGSYTPQGSTTAALNLAKYPTVQKMFVDKTLNLDRRNVPVPSGLEEMFANVNGQYYLDKSWYNDILYEDGMEVNIYYEDKDNLYTKIESTSSNPLMEMLGGSIMQQMLKPEFIEMQYDILNTNGKLPTTANEIALVVDDRNAISDTTLMALGLWNIGDSKTEYSFDELMNFTFKIASNDALYSQKQDGYYSEKASATEIDFTDSEDILTVRISAVLRLKEDVPSGVLSTGIAYPAEAVNWLKTKNMESKIVRFMESSGNELRNPFSGAQYSDTVSVGMGGRTLITAAEVRDTEIRKLGGGKFANSISIYARNLTSKDSIKAVLDSYNAGKTEEESIYYIDIVEIIGSVMSSMVDVISYVLIAFTSISLIVSAVMISIITSISVMERTKEIGILRAIGSRKKDVTRLFNAENVILGVFSGVIGMGVAMLISIPINSIMSSLAGVRGIVSFEWWHALVLVGLSTGVAFISGFLPARKAAKKDPVLALRTE